MTSADLWYYFWIVAFVIAGTAFALIAAVVLVRGIGDLRALIELLKQGSQDDSVS